jgi:hypothetical protein
MSVDRYLVTSDLVVQHEQGMWVRYEDHAAALTAERQRAERAMLLAWGGVAGPNWAWSGGDIEEVAERIRHRGDELQEQVKQLTAERAKFAAGERTHVLDALCDMGWPQLASDLQARLEQKDAATKQAAEDAAGGKK